MIIYNITVKVDLDISADFLDWVKSVVLYEANSNEPHEPSRCYLLRGVDMTDGMTYCIQHYFADIASYNDHMSAVNPYFQEEMTARYGDKVVSFSSVLSEV